MLLAGRKVDTLLRVSRTRRKRRNDNGPIRERKLCLFIWERNRKSSFSQIKLVHLILLITWFSILHDLLLFKQSGHVIWCQVNFVTFFSASAVLPRVGHIFVHRVGRVHDDVCSLISIENNKIEICNFSRNEVKNLTDIKRFPCAKIGFNVAP